MHSSETRCDLTQESWSQDGVLMQDLMTAEQLSKIIHKTVASIRSDATRNPISLPPICRLPNTKRLLWRLEDVEQWLACHVCTPQQPPLPSSINLVVPAKRGRPTKAEQIARNKKRSVLPIALKTGR
ncbi:DNA-binding protein [Yersinia enterocolitica]|nr:DNA-binding protein [Yersinia enterocolitica]PHZ24762.1 hypothetical protein CS535_04050 [Yersinia massiliensis]CCQ39650.1 hypothetical protein YE5303_09411 [Yersinia enterocolitica (type O:5) str. YE53/03]EKN3343024.1 DNA-binding protein [Yersinia enterocolitica]EKN3395196.1 DNA-binding protein [Yersinia enterocolitica]